MSVESKFFIKLLKDGEWHPVEQVIQRLGDAIAPGKALRRYEDKEATRREMIGDRVRPELSRDGKIASGRRALANITFNAMKQRYVETRTDAAGARWVRRDPNAPELSWEKSDGGEEGDGEAAESEAVASPQATGTAEPADVSDGYNCPFCGLWVVNHVQHELWHVDQGDGKRRASRRPDENAAGRVSVLTEGQVRTVVRNELTAVLGAFFDRDVAVTRRLIRSELESVIDVFGKGVEEVLIERLCDIEQAVAAKTAASL